MSRLSEYVKMVGQGLKDPEAVIRGWINDAKLQRGDLPEDEEAEILRRRAICETCPYMSRNAMEAGIYYTKRPDDHCILCSCPIKKKTADLESNCGIEEFNKQNKRKQKELKWTAYIKPQKDDEHS